MIEAADLAGRLAGLDGIGEGPDGVTRLAWTAQDAACRAWFADQAAALGRAVEVDPAGNLWAVPDGGGPWWALGSHLDSVRAGGRLDGPLGVAAAFAVAARARAPVAVLCLADEEGARFATPTFGSRALTGRLDVDDALARRDDAGVTLRDALAAAGVDPGRLGEAPAWLGRLRGFLELHIDQTRELAVAGRAWGAVRGLAARMRVEVEVRGAAGHAGTTPPEERRDALRAAAHLVAGLDDPEVRTTVGRLLVEPNATSTIAARARLWIDARCPDQEPLDGWWRRASADAQALAAAHRVTLRARVVASSPATPFDPEVRAALGGGRDDLLSWAGHDAGVLATEVPAGMVFVRNPTGVSHAPEEDVSLGDAALGATALLGAVERLAA